MTRSRRLVPFLLALGPLWIALFASSSHVVFRIAGAVGALALSLGLVLMLAQLSNLEEKVARLSEPLPSPRDPSPQKSSD